MLVFVNEIVCELFVRGLECLIEILDDFIGRLQAHGKAARAVRRFQTFRVLPKIVPKWEVVTGLVIRDSTPPRLGAWMGMVAFSMNRSAVAASPFNSKLIMPEKTVEVFFRVFMAGMAFQAGIVDPFNRRMALQIGCDFQCALVLMFHPHRQGFHSPMQQETGVRIQGAAEMGFACA